MRPSEEGEKRLGPSRIKPDHALLVDAGRSCFSKVRNLNHSGLLVESQVMLDMDCEWHLMIQADAESVGVKARIVHESKKSDEARYAIQLEFLECDDSVHRFISGILHAMGSPDVS